MTSKIPGLWAKADDVQRWRDSLHELRDRTNELLGELGDMQMFRVSIESVDNLADAPAPAKSPIADEDAPKPVASSRGAAKPEAVLKAQADNSKGVAKAVKPPKPVKAKPEGVKTRMRIGAYTAHLASEHGAAVANYAANTILQGDKKTTADLKAVMKSFLGTFADAVHAGHAYAEAQGREGLDADEAMAALGEAKHKLVADDGSYAVWSIPSTGGAAAAAKAQPAPTAAAPAPAEEPEELEADDETETGNFDGFLAADEDDSDEGLSVELDDEAGAGDLG